MLVQVIGAFAAVIAASITFGVPKRFLLYSGLQEPLVGWSICYF